MPETKEEKKLYTYEEYLELEKVSEARMEYHLGEVYALAGSTKSHYRISLNITFNLEKQLSGRPCEVFGADIKLELIEAKKYVYPDVMLTCSEDELNNDDETIIRNPSLIIEVLSKSTEDYDRNGKFQEYIKIPSLKHYLLVSQSEKRIECYSRQEHDFWYYRIFEKSDAKLIFEDLDLLLTLKDVYQKVSF